MNNKLSHSSVTKYTDCSKAWELHYKKGYRGNLHSSALLFGTALDKALETFLKTKDEDQTKKMFMDTWTEQKLNGVSTQLISATNIVYANSDFDYEVLEQLSGLGDDLPSKEQVDKLYELKDTVGYDNLPEARKKELNFINWHVMRIKGLLMVEEAIKQIKNNVTEVLGTQVKVELANSEGDSIIGYADAVVKWKGYDAPIILDFKTSSKMYEDNAVITSPQLSLYVHGLSSDFGHTRHAGFFVLNKHIRKNKIKICSKCGFDGTGGRHKTCSNIIEGERCEGEWNEKLNPSIFTQIIINEIPEKLEEIVIENMNMVNSAIKTGIFPRNLQSCIKPYGKCAFYEICHKDDYSQVIKKEE
jgi:hypothetical protein